MARIGVADFGMFAWYGGFYDYDERLFSIRKIGYDGLERLYPDSAEDALRKAAQLKKLGMGFATCNAATPENAIKWTAALGGDYVWGEVYHGSFADYLRRMEQMGLACRKYGIRVALHNHLGSPVETQEQLETVLEKCPHVDLLLDTGHLAVAGGDVRYIVDTYYDRIAAYHLKSWQQSATPDAQAWQQRGHFCGLEQGDFPIDNKYVFKNALNRGFDGWIFVEQDTHQRDPLLDLEENYHVLEKWGWKK